MKVKKGKVGTGKENRVCKLKVETFSLLISILIHLGLLTAPFFFSPPESTKYIKSIKVDYIISLPKINHRLRESPGKSIVSPLTLASGRENRELLKPSSILTKKLSISSNLRFQERILSLEETSNSRKRESLFLFPSPVKVGVPTAESNSLREGTSKMVSKIPGVNLSIDKATIFSSFSPLTRVGKSSLMRKIEGRVYLFREENLSQKRLADHTSSLATKPLGLNQTLPLRQRERTLAFVGLPFKEKKSELMPASYLPTERNLNSFPMRKSEKNYLHHQIRITEEGIRPEIIISRASRVFPYKKAALREPNPLPRISLGKAKAEVSHKILSTSLDPMVQPRIRSYSPTIKEKKFSPLTSEPDFHREEIRILKEDTELLTDLLRLREYAEKIRKLINANKKYPSVARQRGWEGRIKIRFMINSSGRVIKTEVLSPCSYEVLNRAAEKLIKDTSPFPSFPSSWHKNSLTVEVQVIYQLKEPIGFSRKVLDLYAYRGTFPGPKVA